MKLSMAPMLFADLSLPEIPLWPLLLGVGLSTAILLAVGALWVLTTNRHIRNDQHHRWYSVLAYTAFLITTAILAVTSFGALLQYGHLSGYPLMGHISAAGGFVFLLLAITFLYLPVGTTSNHPGFTSDNRWWVARWSAWGLVLSSLLAAGTMLLSMLPIFGTEMLLWVASLHRYAGLTVVVFAVLHLYALICTRLGLR